MKNRTFPLVLALKLDGDSLVVIGRPPDRHFHALLQHHPVREEGVGLDGSKSDRRMSANETRHHEPHDGRFLVHQAFSRSEVGKVSAIRKAA